MTLMYVRYFVTQAKGTSCPRESLAIRHSWISNAERTLACAPLLANFELYDGQDEPIISLGMDTI